MPSRRQLNKRSRRASKRSRRASKRSRRASKRQRRNKNRHNAMRRRQEYKSDEECGTEDDLTGEHIEFADLLDGICDSEDGKTPEGDCCPCWIHRSTCVHDGCKGPKHTAGGLCLDCSKQNQAPCMYGKCDKPKHNAWFCLDCSKQIENDTPGMRRELRLS